MRTVIFNRNSPGVIKDLPGTALPPEAFTRVENARFRNGLGERFGGRSALGISTSPTPYQIFPFKPYNLDGHVILAGSTKVHISDGTTTTDITGASGPYGAIQNEWTFTNFNGIPVLNYAGKKPQALTTIPGGPLVDLPNWPATWLAQSIRSYKNVLVGLNITQGASVYPNMIVTSSITDPGAVPASWDNNDPATLAFEDLLAANDDDDDISIVDGGQLKDIFVIYKRTSVSVMSVGGQNIYTIQKTFDKGALNKNCIVRPTMREAQHIVVGLDDIFIHNGYREESVLENRMRRWLFDQIDPDNAYMVHAAHNRKTNELFVPFPEQGAAHCNLCFYWNYKNGNQSIIELDPTWGLAVGPFVVPIPGSDTWESDELGWEDDTVTWGDVPTTALRPRMMQAGTDGLYLLDEAAPDKTVIFERTHMPLLGRAPDGAPIWDTDTVKQVNAVWPRFEGTGTVSVSIGVSDSVNETITWSTPLAFDMASTSKLDVGPVEGRILHTRFTATDTGQWRFMGYDLDIVPVGQ